MAGEGKERYRIMIIVLLMRCIRPLLRELIRQIAARKTPHGESEWTVDDYLRHNRTTVERKLPKIGKDSKYKNILYPPNSVKQKTDLGKWDLTLYLFIFNDIAMVDCNIKCYLESVSSIRKHLCSRDVHGVTKVVNKEYRRRLKRARSWLYKILHDKELEKLVQRRVRNIEKERMEQSEVDEVLARWKTLECDITEDGIEKTGFQKYLTISVLLNEVCCEVMRALVTRRVVDKTHYSLQSFLHINETRIRRRSDTLDKWGRSEEKLFPRHGEPNLEEWDICLLFWVLLKICYLGEIKNEHDHPIIEDAIGTFRRIRNEIVHDKPNVILSKEEYNSYLEGIRCGVNDCLYFLNDKDISDDILNKIEDIENERFGNDETMQRVQTSYHNEKNEHVLHTKYLEGQVSIHKELSEIVRLHKGVTLPETQLEILIENCSQESEEILSKMLVQKINNNIAGNEPRSVEDDGMTVAVANLIKTWRSKGWNPVSSTKGSVLLHAQCVSFDNLCELFDTYGNTGSAMCVEDIQTAARRFIGDNVNICCIMYDSVMNKAMENIVCQLLEITEQQVARAGKAENNYRASVNVLMAPGFNGISSDISSLISEDVRGRLRRIADILKKQYGLTNCSITTRSYDFCTPSLVTEEKCDGVTESDDNKMTWDNAYGDINPVNDDQPSLNMEYETLRCVADRPVTDEKCNDVSKSDGDTITWNNSDGDTFSTNGDQQSLSMENERLKFTAKRPDFCTRSIETEKKSSAVTESDDDKMTWKNSCGDINPDNDDQQSLHMETEAFRCIAGRPDYSSHSLVTDVKCNDVSKSDGDTITWNNSDGDTFSTNGDQQSPSMENEARRCYAKLLVTLTVIDDMCNEVPESDDDTMTWNNYDGDPFSINDNQQLLSIDNDAPKFAAERPGKPKMSGQQFANAKNRNWVKAALGLMYVKDGLAPFCDDIVNHQHAGIVNKVKQKHKLTTPNCGQCNLRTLQPDHLRTKYMQCPLGQNNCNCQNPGRTVACPNNVCGAIYDEIINLHASIPPSPNWKNTDAKLWCTQPWSIAKCFINAAGYSQKSTALEIDCLGLLQVLVNNKGLQQHIQCQSTGTDAFSKVRQYRNKIFHSTSLELEDNDVQAYIDDMIAVLEDGKELNTRAEARVAVKKLVQLKRHGLKLTTSFDIAENTAANEQTVFDKWWQKSWDITSKLEAAFPDLKQTYASLVAVLPVPTCFDIIQQKTKQIARDEIYNKGKVMTASLAEHLKKKDKVQIQQDLCMNLICFYKRILASESYVFADYVHPVLIKENIDFLTRPSSFIDHSKGETEEVISVHDIFGNEGNSGKVIRLLEDAGAGKSTFLKFLISHWCMAHSPIKHDIYDTDLITEMKNFDFLFYLPLSHVTDCSSVTGCFSIKMILNKAYSHPMLDILEQTEFTSCLIILDGLDKLTSPAEKSNIFRTKELPELGMRKSCTVFTTLRTRNVGTSRIKEHNIDLTVRLKKMSLKENPETLKPHSIETIGENNIKFSLDRCDKTSLASDSPDRFDKTSPAADSPDWCNKTCLASEDLVCHWFYGKLIGTSKCAIHHILLDLFLQWAHERNQEHQRERNREQQRKRNREQQGKRNGNEKYDQ